MAIVLKTPDWFLLARSQERAGSKKELQMKTWNVVVALLCMVSFAQAGNLDNSISLPGFEFSYGTSSAGGKTNFDARMANEDPITGVGIRVRRDNLSPTQGWVDAWFNGITKALVTPMTSQSQSLNIDRHGIEFGSYVSLGSYQQIVGWSGGDKGDEPIYGDWMSDAWASATLFDVQPTWANANYEEWLDESSGIVHFSANVTWRIDFANETQALEYSSLDNSQTTIPEPASMAILASGALLLWRRRH